MKGKSDKRLSDRQLLRELRGTKQKEKLSKFIMAFLVNVQQ